MIRIPERRKRLRLEKYSHVQWLKKIPKFGKRENYRLSKKQNPKKKKFKEILNTLIIVKLLKNKNLEILPIEVKLYNWFIISNQRAQKELTHFPGVEWKNCQLRLLYPVKKET